MITTTLETSKKLYELTEWIGSDFVWIDLKDNEPLMMFDKPLSNSFPTRYQDAFEPGIDWLPAYDTGYLIDMLTEKKTGLTLYHVHSTMQYEAFYAGKFFEYGTDTQHWEYQSDNPAEALALLAIDLIENKVIKP